MALILATIKANHFIPKMRIQHPILMLLCSLQPVFSQEGSLTFQLDNDLFANTDKDYTNGARLSYITGGRQASDFTDMESWLESVQNRAPDIITGLYAPEDPVYNYGFSVTQLMFTPTDFEPAEPPPGQHPYVGWLAFGFSLHAKDANATNSIELSLGTTGKNAFAETTQDFVHSVRDIEKFNGWDSQMPSELTLNLFFTQKRRLFKDEPTDVFFGMDGFGEWRVALGNYKTGLDIGFVNRVGFNLPVEFSDPRLGPTSYSHDIFDTQLTNTSNWSGYGLFGARASAIWHDIALDGPLFRDFEMGINKKGFLGEAYIGGAIRFKKWELSYSHTFRTKEFDEQPNGAQFGSLALRIRY